jgi:hypothetical protein
LLAAPQWDFVTAPAAGSCSILLIETPGLETYTL